MIIIIEVKGIRYGRFPEFIVVFGPRPWHIEIRHRVKKTSTNNLFGFETLELKIRRLKLWKPTVLADAITTCRCDYPRVSCNNRSRYHPDSHNI